HEAVRLVARFRLLAALLVVFGELLGILDHLFDVGFRKAAGGLDADLLFLAGALVLGGHVADAARVSAGGDFVLRPTSRGRRDTDEVELAEKLVVRRHFAFTLKHADRHRLLVVIRGGVSLRLLGRNRGIAIDHAGEYAAQRFDTER